MRLWRWLVYQWAWPQVARDNAAAGYDVSPVILRREAR